MCMECGEEAKAGLSRYQDMLPERLYCISGDSLKDCNVVGESFVLIAEKAVFYGEHRRWNSGNRMKVAVGTDEGNACLIARKYK